MAEVGLIVSALLQLVLVIVFCVMAANVSKLCRAARVQAVLLRMLLRKVNPEATTPADEKIDKLLVLSAKGETWRGW